jgi:hypothetical protein
MVRRTRDNTAVASLPRGARGVARTRHDAGLGVRRTPDHSAPVKPPPSPQPAGEIVELSRFRAELGRGRRARRADALRDADDLEAAVRALPPDEFYYVIHELGFPDALDILQHGTPDQVKTALDFALWDRDQLAPADVDEWLGAMVEAPYEAFGAWAKEMDVELLALLLRRRARVYDVSIEEPPDEPEGTMITTPDRLFVLDLLGSDDERRITHHMVDSLYRHDQNWIRKVLVGSRGELDSELEELAFRWRSGRMADLGFEDYYDALEVYREIDPATVRAGSDAAPRVLPLGDDGDATFLRMPTALAERLATSSPFARAVAGISAPEELANVKAALVSLSNRVLAADRVQPGDDQEVGRVLGRLAATLDLAVELLGRGHADEAVRAVRTIPLVRLFRLGVTLVGKVRQLAVTLNRTPLAHLGGDIHLFEADDADVIAEVSRARPLYPCRLDDPPGPGTRPFSSLADVARATAAVERAGAALALLHALGLRPTDLAPAALGDLGITDPAAVDAGLLARTALARLWLGRGDAPLWRALDAGELRTLQNRLKKAMKDPEGTAKTVAALKEILAPVAPGGRLAAAVEAVADRWIGGLLTGDAVLARTM